jgi:hypothetical protein
MQKRKELFMNNESGNNDQTKKIAAEAAGKEILVLCKQDYTRLSRSLNFIAGII